MSKHYFADQAPDDRAPITCPKCGWTGIHFDLSLEAFNDLAQYSCPDCDTHLALVSYATSGRPPRPEPADPPAALRFGVALDCSDAYRLAEFWTAALSYVRLGSSGTERPLVDPAGRAPDLILHEVDEPKTGKNRMHLDLHAGDIEAEVERLIALGATRAHDAGSTPRILMADPEGNEFCVCHG